MIGQNREVIVILGSQQQRATVVRSHPGRDVALLKLEKRFTAEPLRVNDGRVNLGEEIYVVGTPLDESLSFSISRGIISARRTYDQRSYYQTDAAVNPAFLPATVARRTSTTSSRSWTRSRRSISKSCNPGSST